MLLLNWLSAPLLISGVGAQQPTAPQTAPAKITFEEPAAPLIRLMPDLAAATHLPLHVTHAIEDEVLLVDVRDVTADELMKRIAQATGGTWTQAKDGIYLGSEFGKRTVIQDRALQARAVKLGEELKQLSPEAVAAAAAAAEKKPAGKPGEVDYAAMMMGSMRGGDEVFYRILSAEGPQMLATLFAGDRAVLSTRPTGKQFQMPDAGDWLASYITRHNTQVAKAKAEAAAAVAKGGDGGDEGEMPDMSFNPGARYGGELIAQPPAKAIFILERGSGMINLFGGQDITCQLVLYDQKGKVIQQERGGLGSPMDMEEMAAIMDEAQHKTKPVGTEKPLELSPEAKLFAGYLRSMSGGGPGGAIAQLSAERKAQVRERMNHPETFDPLAYPADLLAEYGKVKNAQVVACLPDSFANWLITLLLGNQTPSAVLKKLTRDGNLVVDNTDGWLIVSPANFKFEPINRGDLKKAADILSAMTEPDLDLLSRVAATGIGDEARGMLGQLWLAITNPSTGTMLNQNWDMLRLYGSLSPDQRTTLSQAKRLSISALGQDQRDILERMVYGSSGGMFAGFGGSSGGLSVEDKTDENSLLGPATSELDASMEEYGSDGNQPDDYRAEPTEAAPNGLPPGTAITFKLVSTQVLQPIFKTKKNQDDQPGYNWWDQPMAVEQLAQMIALREQPQGDQAYGQMPKFDHVKIGSRRTMHFRIYVSPESFLPCRLSDCAFPEGSSYALNGLPSDLQKKYDATLKQMRDAYKNNGAEGGGGDTGGGGPPPPPK